MNRAPHRFALIGKTGSGKSEVARILHETMSCRVIKTGAICRQISNILFGNEEKRSTQLLDDALTKIDESIFLRAALRGSVATESLVIDSLRFSSDLNLAAKIGCRTIRVVADDALRTAWLLARGQAFDLGREGRHRSEVELDSAEACVTICNNGSLDDLFERVAASIV
jgi:cytidylate kinase